jgi:dolichyl-phosphate beta-glucosyltransferase
MDGDLAYSLEHLELLVEKLKEFDVVIGCRNLA